MVSGYYSTNDLCERFRITRRTIYRWMDDEKVPFPQPRMGSQGAKNLWAQEDVHKWEYKKYNNKRKMN